MSTVSPTLSRQTIRCAVYRDQPQLAELARRADWPVWVQQDLPRLLQSRYTSCQVVEASGCLAGFAIGSIRYALAARACLKATVTGLVCWVTGRGCGRTLVDLFDVATAPAEEVSSTVPALLGRLYLELRRKGQCARIIVPETSLRTQVFLQRAGYQAVRVLRCYYGDQDGYLMKLASERH